MKSSPAAALEQIPGWESASWTPIDGGLTNRVWLVEVVGVKGLLKVDNEVRGIPFVDRQQEALVQQSAAAAGVANPVLYASETVLLTEYSEGQVWTRDSFDIDDNLHRLAGALKKVHSLPPIRRRFDAVAAAESYMSEIGDADPVMAGHCLETIRAARPQSELRCCHNDLVAENILGADGLRLLDWEYAADNEPLFDLAVIVAHHGLTERQADVLLDAYFDGDGARWRENLTEQTGLYRSLCWLWEAARA